MKSCPFVDTTLLFSERNITPCYMFFSPDVPFYINNEIKGINFEQRKTEISKMLNTSDIQNYICKNCCHLRDVNSSEKKYNHFIISLWENNSFGYNFCQIIQDLYEKDLIDKENLKIDIQSKDFTSMENLTEIIELFDKFGYKEIVFMMNNAVYLPIIEKTLINGKGYLYIILDYKSKGKNADKELGLQQILRSYIVCAKNKNAISVHYQYMKNFNNDIKDITQFIKTMYRIGINKIGFNLENECINKWLNEPVPLSNCPKKLDKHILLFFKLAKHYSFFIDMSYNEQNIVLNKIFKTNKKTFSKKFKKFFSNK